MSQRFRLTVLLLALALVAAMVAGCGGGTPADKDQPAAGSKQAVSDNKDTGVPLADLFVKERVKKVDSMSFDSIFTDQANNQKTTAKMWIKGQQTKVQTTDPAGNTIINIMKPDVLYMVMPAEKTAMKYPLPKDKEAKDPVTITESEKWNPAYFKDGGRVVVDGKQCRLVEHQEQNWGEKYYIWEEYGFPVKVETFQDGKPLNVMEFKNLTVNSVADSEFELPAGVQVMDLPVGIQGSFSDG
ncbi:MAG: hypothetical protein PHC60_03530 [Heliobacteriaceae bacterium]|nr:hypothetical protein [Heliobacteriaceae bacterium]MDD4587451.1 hypothetical protein [Heliobacteriaceae bacterium]